MAKVKLQNRRLFTAAVITDITMPRMTGDKLAGHPAENEKIGGTVPYEQSVVVGQPVKAKDGMVAEISQSKT